MKDKLSLGWAAVIFCGTLLLLASAPKQQAKHQSTHLFYTGEVNGELEPCGCSGVKLGGLQQRSGWIEHWQQQVSPLLLVAGGFAGKDQTRQSKLKLATYQKMLQELDYDFMFASNLYDKAQKNSDQWDPKIFPLSGERKLGVVSLIHEASPEKNKLQKFIKKQQPDVLLVLQKGFRRSISPLVQEQKHLWRFVIQVDESEPRPAIEIADKLISLSAGNQGRHGGILTLNWQDNLQWQNQTFAITNAKGYQPKIQQIFQDYLEQVKQENLLERQVKKISPVGFVGSEMCSACHQYEYQKWSQNSHSTAFETLEKEGRQYDPDCVACHVVGFEYEEGFRTPEQSDYLMHVGCESCHGPGARHVSFPRPGYGKTSGKRTCVECHNHKHSPDFDYLQYREQIKHWQD